MESKIIAVVVSFNRSVLVTETIDGLLSQSIPLHKVIIIDNASTDGAADTVERRYGSHPVVELVRLNENTGGAGGFHEGILRANQIGCDFVWVMDDDAEPETDCLQKLITTIGKDSSCIAVAPAVIGLDGNRQLLHRGKVGNWFVPNIQVPIPNPSYEEFSNIRIQTASFVGLLFRAAIIDSIGLPEQSFFIYNDDLEYCLRIQKLGKIILDTKAVIIHKDGNRVDNRKAWGFVNYQYIPLDRFHLIYLNRRNLIWTVRKHIAPSLKRNIALLIGATMDCLKVLLTTNHKLLRIRVLLLAYSDGINSNLGPVPKKIASILKE